MQENSKPRVYLAAPIQHVNDYGKGWRNRLKQDVEAIEWVDPLAKYNSQEVSEINDEWSDERIVMEDLELIESCDAILVHWQEVPSCGTPMEIAYAIQVFEIPVIVQTTVEEPSPWLTAHATEMVETFEEAVEAIYKHTA